MAVPPWQSPVVGAQALAGHVNQLLGTHPTTYLYQGVLQASSAGGTGTASSSGTWLAQRFTTGSSQTAVGYLAFASAVTGSPAPWTVSLQADAAGQPSGTALASVQYPKELAATVTAALVPSACTASTQMWIVAEAVGDVSDYFTWAKSSAGSGAMTSPDGVTWTAQSYGLRYVVYDQSTVPPLIGIVEDSGARYTLFGWSGTGEPVLVEEFTSGQTQGGYSVSARTLTYSGGMLTGAA